MGPTQFSTQFFAPLLWSHGPPSKPLKRLGMRTLVASVLFLTTRPQRVMAGGQEQGS